MIYADAERPDSFSGNSPSCQCLRRKAFISVELTLWDPNPQDVRSMLTSNYCRRNPA